MSHPFRTYRPAGRALPLLALLALLAAGLAHADVLITGSGKEFDVSISRRTDDGLIVQYQGRPALVRWKNISWISGTAVFTMNNGARLVFYAVRPTDAGWICRPTWVREGGLFELDRGLVRSVTSPLEIEREYHKLMARIDREDLRQQFDALDWCLARGRDRLAASHARALRETRNAWTLAVVMQEALTGAPHAEIPSRGTPERTKAVLRTLYRTVAESRHPQHVAAVGYRILAFDLAVGRVPRPTGEVKAYLDGLYVFAEEATRARAEYDKILENRNRAVDCPKCKGTGRVRGRYIGRQTDERLGELLSDGKALDIREGFEIVQCPRCEGSGKVVSVTDLPPGPAGIRKALPPAQWQRLVEATDKFLDLRVPMELNTVQIRGAQDDGAGGSAR